MSKIDILLAFTKIFLYFYDIISEFIICYRTLFNYAKSDPSPSPQWGEGIATPFHFGLILTHISLLDPGKWPLPFPDLREGVEGWVRKWCW